MPYASNKWTDDSDMNPPKTARQVKLRTLLDVNLQKSDSVYETKKEFLLTWVASPRMRTAQAERVKKQPTYSPQSSPPRTNGFFITQPQTAQSNLSRMKTLSSAFNAFNGHLTERQQSRKDPTSFLTQYNDAIDTVENQLGYMTCRNHQGQTIVRKKPQRTMPDMSQFNMEPGTTERKVKQSYMDRISHLQRRIMTYEEMPEAQKDKYRLTYLA